MATPSAALWASSSTSADQNDSTRPTPAAPAASTTMAASRVVRRPQNLVRISTRALPAMVARAVSAAGC
jgi:hypothetical protein